MSGMRLRGFIGFGVWRVEGWGMEGWRRKESMRSSSEGERGGSSSCSCSREDGRVSGWKVGEERRETTAEPSG